MLEIRKLQIGDYESFLKCLSRLSKTEKNIDKFYENFKKKKRNTKVFVATMDGEVAGTASLLLEPKFSNGYKNVGHLEDVVTLEKYKGLGIGKALIKRVVEYAKVNNCYKIVLECNTSLLEYYKKFGFKENGISMRLDL